MTPEEQSAFALATQHGYSIQDLATSTEVVQAFQQWCSGQGRPLVTIEVDGSASITLIFDTGSVWRYFLPHYQSLHEKPFFFTLDPTEELQIQVRHIINASGFQGGAGYGGSYTWIAGLSIEHAERTAQALLSIWEQAQAIHLARLAQNDTTSDR